MGKCAVYAVFYPFPILFYILRRPRAVFSGIQRAVAKQTVKIREPLMAWKILALFIFKKSI